MKMLKTLIFLENMLLIFGCFTLVIVIIKIAYPLENVPFFIPYGMGAFAWFLSQKLKIRD